MGCNYALRDRTGVGLLMPPVTFVVGSLFGGSRLQVLLELIQRASETIGPCDLLVNRQLQQERSPQGFPKVYNRLINAAFADPECEYVIVCGDDVRPVGDCIAKTLDVMRADETIGAAFPVEAWAETPVVLSQPMMVTMMPFTGEKRPIAAALSDDLVEQIFAGFALACIRADAWADVGPMDETLGLGYAEDLDWGIRCWKAGYRCVNVRSAWFEHERGATYNRLVAEGTMDAKEPHRAAANCKAKWPFLWEDPDPVRSSQKIMEMLRGWYTEARTR